MNLLFLTIEFQRAESGDDLVSLPGPRRPSLRRRFFGRSIVRPAAVLVCAFGAAVAALLIGGLASGLTGGLPRWLPVSVNGSERESETAQLTVTSAPVNAVVLLDGRERGHTPISLAVVRGRHTLELTHPTAIDEQRQLDISSDMQVNVAMFERRPTAVQLKPAYPGASLGAATFLDDGRLALAMALPGQAGDGNTSGTRILNEAWIFDPVSGSLVPFTTPSSDPRAAILAVSPDASRVAYAQPLQLGGKAGKRLAEVVVADSDSATRGRVFALAPPDSASGDATVSSGELEEIHDITWTPDGGRLLVVVRLVGAAGGSPAASRSRVLLVDANPSDVEQLPPVELLTLPADITSGSYTWAPDGRWVAFLTRAGSGYASSDFTALCALDIGAAGDVSGFRYIADLGKPASSTGTLPVADLAWSPTGDGHLLYTAPTPRLTVSNPLGLPTSSGGAPGLFWAIPAAPALTAEEGQRFGSATGLFGAAWIPTDDVGGQRLIALARSNDSAKPLVIKAIDAPEGTPQNVGIVLAPGVGGSTAAGARWDVRHGRLLLVAPRADSSNGLDYWVVQVLAQGGES